MGMAITLTLELYTYSRVDKNLFSFRNRWKNLPNVQVQKLVQRLRLDTRSFGKIM